VPVQLVVILLAERSLRSTAETAKFRFSRTKAEESDFLVPTILTATERETITEISAKTAITTRVSMSENPEHLRGLLKLATLVFIASSSW
jgi:hypothetical protein